MWNIYNLKLSTLRLQFCQFYATYRMIYVTNKTWSNSKKIQIDEILHIIKYGINVQFANLCICCDLCLHLEYLDYFASKFPGIYNNRQCSLLENYTSDSDNFRGY